MNTTSVEVTAGLGGFLVVFVLGITVWLLGRDLSRRLRRMRLREEARLAQESRLRAEATPAERTRSAGQARSGRPSAGGDPHAGDGQERGRPV